MGFNFGAFLGGVANGIKQASDMQNQKERLSLQQEALEFQQTTKEEELGLAREQQGLLTGEAKFKRGIRAAGLRGALGNLKPGARSEFEGAFRSVFSEDEEFLEALGLTGGQGESFLGDAPVGLPDINPTRRQGPAF